MAPKRKTPEAETPAASVVAPLPPPPVGVPMAPTTTTTTAPAAKRPKPVAMAPTKTDGEKPKEPPLAKVQQSKSPALAPSLLEASAVAAAAVPVLSLAVASSSSSSSALAVAAAAPEQSGKDDKKEVLPASVQTMIDVREAFGKTKGVIVLGGRTLEEFDSDWKTNFGVRVTITPKGVNTKTKVAIVYKGEDVKEIFFAPVQFSAQNVFYPSGNAVEYMSGVARTRRGEFLIKYKQYEKPGTDLEANQFGTLGSSEYSFHMLFDLYDNKNPAVVIDVRMKTAPGFKTMTRPEMLDKVAHEARVQMVRLLVHLSIKMGETQAEQNLWSKTIDAAKEEALSRSHDPAYKHLSGYDRLAQSVIERVDMPFRMSEEQLKTYKQDPYAVTSFHAQTRVGSFVDRNKELRSHLQDKEREDLIHKAAFQDIKAREKVAKYVSGLKDHETRFKHPMFILNQNIKGMPHFFKNVKVSGIAEELAYCEAQISRHPLPPSIDRSQRYELTEVPILNGSADKFPPYPMAQGLAALAAGTVGVPSLCIMLGGNPQSQNRRPAWKFSVKQILRVTYVALPAARPALPAPGAPALKWATPLPEAQLLLNAPEEEHPLLLMPPEDPYQLGDST